MASPTKGREKKSKSPSKNPKHKNLTSEDIILEKKKDEIKLNQDWLNSVYDVNLFSNDELLNFYESIRFKGFNRLIILKKLEEWSSDPKLISEAIIVCAIRGPQKASLIPLSNGSSLMEMGIPASGKQGTEELSCNRIASATADLAAFYLKKLNVPKRLNMSLPGWLQFPTAGSIKLPKEFRTQHIEFSKAFSVTIGGVFNEQIYSQMVNNAYLNDNLKLF